MSDNKNFKMAALSNSAKIKHIWIAKCRSQLK